MRALLLVTLAACSAPTSLDSFRIVLISDTHVTGPQYVCCTENGDMDNSSIQHTEERLNRVVDSINAIDPPPDLVVITGDVMHNPYYSLDPSWYATTESAWTITPRILARLNMPVYPAWGNHDYDIECASRPRIERDISHQLFRDHYDVDPYYAVDHNGWRFLLGNSMLGATWDYTNAETCNTEVGSYGAEQLSWVDAQLADGLPTLFFSHYPEAQTAMLEVPGSAAPDIMTVLGAHENLVAHFAGHDHRFLEFQNTAYPQFMVSGTRYDADNYWLIELDENGGYRILDRDKSMRFSPCSDTWDYSGAPRPADPQPAEDGDCG